MINQGAAVSGQLQHLWSSSGEGFAGSCRALNQSSSQTDSSSFGLLMKKALNLTVFAWLALRGVTQRGADGEMHINVSAQEQGPLGGLCGCMVQACPHLPLQALSPPHQHEGMDV